MSDENHDAGPDAQGAQNSGGSDPSNAPNDSGNGNAEVLAAINEMKAESAREIQSLKNFYEQKLRHAKQGDRPGGDGGEGGKSKGKELTDDERLRNTLEEKLELLNKREEQDNVKNAFADAFKGVEGLAEGAQDLIQESLKPYTKWHKGEAYVEQGEKLVPLKEAVSEKAKIPLFRAPVKKEGTKQTSATALSRKSDGTPLNLLDSSKEDHSKRRQAVLNGDIVSFEDPS